MEFKRDELKKYNTIGAHDRAELEFKVIKWRKTGKERNRKVRKEEWNRLNKSYI